MHRFRFLIASLALLAPAAALAQSFTDVLPEDPRYSAIEYLQEQGIFSGYADGTFRPDRTVNRAEVMKIIVGELEPTTTVSSFSDVASLAWYSPYVEEAYATLHIIDGPPAVSLFRPEQPVTRAEFLKMLLLSKDIDPVDSYAELTYPLATDATASTDWFYPYLRYGLTAAMLEATDGKLEPAAELTRGDIAAILYRFLLYRDDKQTQTLLSAVENNILNALQLVNGSDIELSGQAAARAILAARGALTSRPDDATAKAAVKTAEGTMALVNAAGELAQGNVSSAIDQASTAWHLGAKAMEFSSSMKQLDLQLQSAATTLAERARAGN